MLVLLHDDGDSHVVVVHGVLEVFSSHGPHLLKEDLGGVYIGDGKV
jgi:hypothetical protein